MHSSEIGEQMCGNSLGVWRRAVSTLDPLLASPLYLLGWRGPRRVPWCGRPAARVPVLSPRSSGALPSSQPGNFTVSLARRARLSGLNVCLSSKG